MEKANIGKDSSGRIVVSFPYDPLIVENVKTIEGRRWHPLEKHWSFPSSKGTFEKILEAFGDNEVKIDPALKPATSNVKDTPSPLGFESQLLVGEEGTVPDFVVSAQSNDLRTITPHPPLSLRGDKGGLELGLSPKFDFEDLRKELVSRKYSYKTIKGYIYYNKDFINHVRKDPSEIKDDDIKDYLVYL